MLRPPHVLLLCCGFRIRIPLAVFKAHKRYTAPSFGLFVNACERQKWIGARPINWKSQNSVAAVTVSP